MDKPDYRIESLTGSYEAFGMVLDLLSRHAPFGDSPLVQLAQTVRRQLRTGRQVAAISADNNLLAYAGWVPTTQASAELWVAEIGPLSIVNEGQDAMAMTIVVSTQASVTAALIRRARDLNPDVKWYFKRSYGAQLRPSRKRSLRDKSRRGDDSSAG